MTGPGHVLGAAQVSTELCPAVGSPSLRLVGEKERVGCLV